MPDKGILKYLGEEGIREIISNFYDLLSQSEIRHLFPENKEELEKAKLRSSDFFIQVLGGPSYYKQNRGTPMMSERHAKFKITPEARAVWLKCYQQALTNSSFPDNLKQSIINLFNLNSICLKVTKFIK